MRLNLLILHPLISPSIVSLHIVLHTLFSWGLIKNNSLKNQDNSFLVLFLPWILCPLWSYSDIVLHSKREVSLWLQSELWGWSCMHVWWISHDNIDLVLQSQSIEFLMSYFEIRVLITEKNCIVVKLHVSWDLKLWNWQFWGSSETSLCLSLNHFLDCY